MSENTTLERIDWMELEDADRLARYEEMWKKTHLLDARCTDMESRLANVESIIGVGNSNRRTEPDRTCN